MTTKYHQKWLTFECDDCDAFEEFETAFNKFDDAWTQLKAEGWRAKKIGKDWIHGCPKCGPEL